MEGKHDEMFLEVLKEEKNVVNFLDAFFGFLYRCTDFYVVSKPNEKVGFPAQVSQNLVLEKFQKWKNKSTELSPATNRPLAIEEVETTNRNSGQIQPSECYNGAICDGYSWSQTISDLDILVDVPSRIASAKDLQVEIAAEEIKVRINSKIFKENDVDSSRFRGAGNSEAPDWITIFDGRLKFKTRKDESIWSLVPARHLSIHLEKSAEKWWESLLIDGPKIELSEINCSRDLEDLGVSEQMKVQELMWNQQQKLLGKPTSDQIRMEKVLKQAWDAEGSPFKGTPFDPSVLQFD